MMDGLDLDAPAREPEGVGSAPPRVEAERRGDGLVRPGREEGAPPAPLDGAFRGTLLEAIAEAERRGVEGFRSPARAAVASPRDLAQTIERVREHFPPAAEDRRYALREDGTIHNMVTGRDEYAPARSADVPAEQTAAWGQRCDKLVGGGTRTDPLIPSRGDALGIADLAARARNDPRVVAIMTPREQQIIDAMDATDTGRPAPSIPQTDKAWVAASMAMQARIASPDVLEPQGVAGIHEIDAHGEL